MSYSRDPSLLFEPPNYGFSPPLNFESNVYNGKQPVRYERETLRMPLGSFKAVGERVEVVEVHWLQGYIRFFNSAEEAMNGIAAGCIDKFRIPSAPAMPREYIQETVEFLRRGHSLTHPLCTCHHDISAERCQNLGISHPRSEYNRRRQELPCSLSRRPREFSAKEVSNELGIEDVILFQTCSPETGKNTPLLTMLHRCCNLRMDGLNLHFSCKEMVFGPLYNRVDLLRQLSCNPLPQTFSCLSSYAEFTRDVKELAASGLVHILPPTERSEKEREVTLFYFNPRWDMRGVDQDVIALWHGVDRKEIKTLLDSHGNARTQTTASWIAIAPSPMPEIARLKKRKSAVACHRACKRLPASKKRMPIRK